MHTGIHIHDGGTTLWIDIRHWTQSVIELEENLEMKKKLGLNRLSDFLEVMQRGANPGLLTSNSLPSLYNMVAIIFKQLFHFKSKCHFKGQEITCIMGYFYVNADNYVHLSQPFFPFPNTLLSLIQHYSCYSNNLKFSSKYCCAPVVLFPLISLRFLFF